MARANLSIHSDILREFTNAQESKSIRIMKIRIVDEELRFDSLTPKQNDCNNDFNNSLFSFNEREASIALFCINDEIVDVQSWILIAWVPEGCRVRDKMLYASSREDIKTYLGASFFSSEYYANTFDDLTWENYQQSLRRDFGEEILTEKERLIKEEKSLAQVESRFTKSTALNAIPFRIDSDLEKAFTDFKSGDSNWVSFTVDAEVLKLMESKMYTEASSKIGSNVNQDIASFVFYKYVNGEQQEQSIFIFSCPENIPIRSKMTMSSSKASILAKIGEYGLHFDKNVEIRSASDLDELFKEEDSHVVADEAPVKSSKPQRPGKGRAKIGKFTTEE